MLVSDIKQRKKNFGKWHPGGAIGQDFQQDQADAAAAGMANTTASVTLEYIKSKIIDWNTLTVLKGTLEEVLHSEIATWRCCAAAPYLLLNDSKVLVSTKSITRILSLRSDSEWAESLAAILDDIEYHNVLLLRRCMESELNSLVDAPMAVVYSNSGERVGLYIE